MKSFLEILKIVLISFIVSFLTYSSFRYFSIYERMNLERKVEAPDVVGTTRDQAESILRQAGLSIKMKAPE